MRKLTFETLVSKVTPEDVLQIKPYTERGKKFKSAIVQLGDKYYTDYGVFENLKKSLEKRNIKYIVSKI